MANDGKDDTTYPVDIIGSGLAPDELINWLLKIRGRTFFRLSGEALSDVELTNTMINAAAYARDERTK